MAVDERHRLQLADAAKRAFGDDAGITLMELLPPVGWADVATKQDLAQVAARLDLKIESSVDRLGRQLMTTMIALMVSGFAATIAAVVGVAFAR
jgi:hypothetical protein